MRYQNITSKLSYRGLSVLGSLGSLGYGAFPRSSPVKFNNREIGWLSSGECSFKPSNPFYPPPRRFSRCSNVMTIGNWFLGSVRQEGGGKKDRSSFSHTVLYSTKYIRRYGGTNLERPGNNLLGLGVPHGAKVHGKLPSGRHRCIRSTEVRPIPAGASWEIPNNGI